MAQEQDHQPGKPHLAYFPSFNDSVVEATAMAKSDNYEYDSGDDGSDFEFALAPALTEFDGAVAADELFSHGRIVPAYPVFDRHLLATSDDEPVATASTAPPSPDAGDYCVWTPRSAPGSPERSFPKSASTGEARQWRLRDLIGGRSHSDGKEKFVFLEKMPSPSPSPAPSAATAKAGDKKMAEKKEQKDGKMMTEMDMVTAHKLFYGKGADKQQATKRATRQSYLPYRTGIVGFFANVNALGRSHHPY